MIRTEVELDERLSEPTAGVAAALARVPGDIILLGAGGKMGLSLARMARRAASTGRVIAASRFSSGGEDAFHAHGIETVCCDLLEESDVARLPDAAAVIYMPGRKFGSATDAATTWAVNCTLPAVVCKKYHGRKIVAFSTGNVYPLTSPTSGGPTETDPPNPVGEYGMAALGRERLFEYYSRKLDTPVSQIRLNYACDLRYGVLVDLARAVFAGEPIDLAMGYFNTIWQGDANAMALCALDHAAIPPRIFNVTGPEVLSVRVVCERFGQLFNKLPRFTGTESDTALLNNANATIATLGPLRVDANELIDWVANWVKAGGRQLGKPTHFEVRDGRF